MTDLLRPPGNEWGPEDDAYEAQVLAHQEFQAEVATELHRLRVRKTARETLTLEEAGTLPVPSSTTLTDFLAVDDEPARYRIDQLQPVGGRVVLSAQWKSGKTTLDGNLIRALADTQPFLGHYPVTPPLGRIVLIDNELDQRTLRLWLREQNISNTAAVEILPLRGQTSTFNLLDPATRTRWAQWLIGITAGYVILDCLRPVLDALGLDESREAGRFLEAFDALLVEAACPEALVTHHMGHTQERSRGDSRILDWPDAVWKLVRDTDDRGEQDLNGPRYFSAYGRDVNTPETQLAYDPATRTLTIEGGNRKDAKAEHVIPDLIDYLSTNDGASRRAIEGALAADHSRQEIRTAVTRAIKTGRVYTSPGPRRADLHHITQYAQTGQNGPTNPMHTGPAHSTQEQPQANTEKPSAPSAPRVRRHSESECASASIYGALTAHSKNGSEPPAHSDNPNCPRHGTQLEPDRCYTCEQMTRQ